MGFQLTDLQILGECTFLEGGKVGFTGVGDGGYQTIGFLLFELVVPAGRIIFQFRFEEGILGEKALE